MAPIAILVIAMLAAFAAGVGCLVAGVFLLAGSGWAFVAAGVVLFLTSGLLVRGMKHV